MVVHSWFTTGRHDMTENLSKYSSKIENLEWKYLAEGNSCIVYRCKSHQIVLRLKKENENPDNNVDFSSNEKIHFLKNIVRPIFQDEKYLIFPELVTLSDEFFHYLNDVTLTCSMRPDERFNSHLDKKNRVAFLLPNLGFIQRTAKNLERTFAVEIKPKWGSLPHRNSKIKHEHAVKFSTCRFCMQQHLKLKLGKISGSSEYCPLDLFSKDFCSVKKALTSLFQNPQNNLRIFCEGELIYSGLPVDDQLQNVSYLDEYLRNLNRNDKTHSIYGSDWMIGIVAQILLHDSGQSSYARDHHKDNEHDFVMFGEKGVLSKLLAAQKIDEIGIEEVYQLYKELMVSNVFKEKVNELIHLSSTAWSTFVQDIVTERQSNIKKRSEFLAFENIVYKIQKFLVAGTFKDCSIMITFQKQETCHQEKGNYIVDACTEDVYHYQIKLIDLDPKSADKIPHYFELDHQIIKNYLLHSKGASCC